MARSGRTGAGHGRTALIIAIAVAAALIAEVAVLVIAPGDTGPAPIGAEPGDYFDPAAIDRARGFRDGQRDLFLLGFAVELTALAAMALGLPRFAGRWLRRLDARPIVGSAAAGAGISVLLAALAIPTGLIGHERAVDVGLSTQGVGSWLFDWLRATGIAVALAAIGAMILVALQRRLRRTWWVAATAIVIIYAVVGTWLAPVVLAPVFNDFERLPPGPARDEVIDLADRAGVDVGGVFVVDASARGTGLNAYVDGIGSSRRVVLYDNLLEGVDRTVLRSVVAHELGHVAHDDLARGLLFVAVVAPLGMFLVAVAGTVLARRGGASPGSPSGLPAFVLVIAIVTFALNLAGDQLSRNVEASADRFALQLTEDPLGFIELQQQLTKANLSDPDPSGLLDAALRTHPTAVERIGAALAYAKERGIDLDEPPFPALR